MGKRKAVAPVPESPPLPAHEIVEAARMHHGDPEGDIVGSYSGDRICEGRPIRTPFHWRGGTWVCVGTWGELASAFRLTPLASYTAEATTYSARVGASLEAAEAARNDPNGFYNGVTVTHGGQSFVMTGPEVTFAPGDIGQSGLFTGVPPPIAGDSDVGRETRLEAERATLEFRQRSQKRLDAGRAPILESPLFDGPAQGDLF